MGLLKLIELREAHACPRISLRSPLFVVERAAFPRRAALLEVLTKSVFYLTS